MTTERELLLVYGTLMKGFGANRMLIENGATFVEEALVRDHTLMHLGGFPGMVPHEGSEVIGEIWQVPSTAWPALDRYEGLDSENGPRGLYHRAHVTTSKGQEVQTYIYNTRREIKEGLAQWVKHA